ncbi:Ligand-gated ion channel [Popillia japonica]|uniref:Ligand-gated ion channel n=1 Tax=Popillia japonica TaxID=7064 RepID=A0AAW1KNW2_POPJA
MSIQLNKLQLKILFQLFSFSANGAICCPMAIYPYKRITEAFSNSVNPSWGIGRSVGWMTGETFHGYNTVIHLTYELSVLCNQLRIEIIAPYLNATRILQPADVSAFRPIKGAWKRAVRDWYSHHHGTILNKTSYTSSKFWENYGYWSFDDGLVEYLKKYPLSQRRHDLKQQNLKVMIRITNNDTWNHLEDFRHTSIDGFTKLSFGSSKCLFEYCNANVTYSGTEFFGYKDKTGNYNGIVGALMRGEIDTSGSPMFTRIERVPLITYMTMQSPYYIKFILKKPPLSYVKNIFFSAFEYKVWAAVILSFVVLTIASLFIYNMEAKQTKINFQSKLTLSDAILVSLEILSQQGTYMDLQRMSSRILILTSLVVFYFIFIAYSGNIVAMLQAHVELKSTKQLVDSRLELGAEDINFMQLFLSNMASSSKKVRYFDKDYEATVLRWCDGLSDFNHEKVQTEFIIEEHHSSTSEQEDDIEYR